MPENSLLRKDELEQSLHQETKLIKNGTLKEDSPLNVSTQFKKLCDGCRTGDLKVCQEMIMEGVNINARDPFDYTPLILASLCGHYEVVQLLLEAGALCERDTFQGERCLYNALNNRIRNLLLSYDYSKSSDPLQPLASHIASMLTSQSVDTSDITVLSSTASFRLHKFILSVRSPYFSKKLDTAPETTTWRLPTSIPPQAFAIAISHLYLAELPRDLGGGPGTGYTDGDILAGVDKICKHFELQDLSSLLLDEEDRRLARQRRTKEVEEGRDQLEVWFEKKVLHNAIRTDVEKANEVKWDRDNSIFADVLLRADEDGRQEDPFNGTLAESQNGGETVSQTNALGIPLGCEQSSTRESPPSPTRRSAPCTLFPCHRAMLIRSEFFLAMFSSAFREAQKTPHLQIIPVSCSPAVLEIILTFLYTEKADFPLSIAVNVLYAADQLFLEKLKMRAAVIISTLGSGDQTGKNTAPNGDAVEEDAIDVYEILHVAWLTRVQRLEEFAARYIAYRLEHYIDEPEFADIVRESASRISARQETDSIELLDDIRWYLSERFRLRFEDAGLEEMMGEDDQAEPDQAEPNQIVSQVDREGDGDIRKSPNSSLAGIAGLTSTAQQQQPPPAGNSLTSEGDETKSMLRQGSADATVEASSRDTAISTEDDGSITMPDGATTSSATRIPIVDASNDNDNNDQNDHKTIHHKKDNHQNDEDDDDEFSQNAIQYRLLLDKIDNLLERLELDA